MQFVQQTPGGSGREIMPAQLSKPRVAKSGAGQGGGAFAQPTAGDLAAPQVVDRRLCRWGGAAWLGAHAARYAEIHGKHDN